MGNELNKLAERIAELIIETYHAGNCFDTEYCTGLSCRCCPFSPDNAYTVARGFVKEFVYEHGVEVLDSI